MSERGEMSFEPIDDRWKSYMRLGDMMVSIAERHHHIDIDETTHARWRQLMGIMREVDTWVDDTDVTPQEVLRGIESFDRFRARYPDIAPEALDQSVTESRLARVDRIIKLGVQVATTTSIEEFIEARLGEADETIGFFGDAATPYVQSQPDFKEKCMPTLQAMGEFSVLWDSITDGRSDVKLSRQALVPNGEYYKKLGSAALERLRFTRGASRHFEPWRHFAAHAGIRLVNRFKNGIPEYSTLRVISSKLTKKEIE